jgi:hypothetical protein
MDSIGSLIDKLATINEKLFRAQEDLYVIRKMDFNQFKETFGNSDDKLMKLYEYFKKGTDLNVQRQAAILEIDKKIVEIISAAVRGEDLSSGSFVQDQHKTY